MTVPSPLHPSLHTSAFGLYAGAVAGLVASFSDLLMLAVAYGATIAAEYSDRAGLVLIVGGLLGVVAIPFYYQGYRHSLGWLRTSQLQRWLGLCGAMLVSFFGALTHALTALDIASAQSADTTVRTPTEAFSDPSDPLFIAAALSTAGAVLVTFSLLQAGLRDSRRRVRAAVLMNPVFWTLVLVGLGSLSESIAMYLIPAAPNLAHFAFFAIFSFLVEDEVRRQ